MSARAKGEGSTADEEPLAIDRDVANAEKACRSDRLTSFDPKVMSMDVSLNTRLTAPSRLSGLFCATTSRGTRERHHHHHQSVTRVPQAWLSKLPRPHPGTTNVQGLQ